MKTLVISQREVARLLPMKECTELMAETLRTLSRGDAVLPLRTAMWLPDRSGLLGVMPAYLGSPRSMGLKAVSVMPGNHGTPYDSSRRRAPATSRSWERACTPRPTSNP